MFILVCFDILYSLNWRWMFSLSFPNQLGCLPSSSPRNFSSRFQFCFDFAEHGGSFYCPFNNLTKLIIFFACKYHNYLIMADFSMKPNDSSLKAFLGKKSLNNLIKSNTCFKGKDSRIDLFLTNRKYSFRFRVSYEAIIIDHHMIYRMLKSSFSYTEPWLLP